MEINQVKTLAPPTEKLQQTISFQQCSQAVTMSGLIYSLKSNPIPLKSVNQIDLIWQGKKIPQNKQTNQTNKQNFFLSDFRQIHIFGGCVFQSTLGLFTNILAKSLQGNEIYLYSLSNFVFVHKYIENLIIVLEYQPKTVNNQKKFPNIRTVSQANNYIYKIRIWSSIN